MKTINRIVAVILSGALVCGTFLCSGCTSAESDNEPTNDTYSDTNNDSKDADTANSASGKEEVLYVNLDASGKIKDAYVVNIVGSGNTVDYGDYEWVKMLNTSDEITQQGDVIKFNSSADRVYYEGKLKKAELPWNISLRYFIDGTEYTAEQVAGKSGQLEIKFSVTRNENQTWNFYESYALQTSFTLNTQKCKNISAPNATVANVGKNKQISYTILPGKGIDTSITADVTEFEMGAVSINGVPLAIDMEIDDSELTDKISELQDAVSQASDGANQLAEGLGELSGNNTDLISGTNELKDGLSELAENNQTLVDGARQAYEGLCTAAEQILNARLSENGIEELTLTPENYAQQLEQVIAQLDEELVRAQAEQIARSTVTAQVEENADELYLAFVTAMEDDIYLQYVKSIENDIYSQYINENADSIYFAYVKAQNDENSDALYLRYAYQYAYQSALASGLTEEQATAYAESQYLTVYANLTDDDKTAIIWAAVDELTYKQMKTILAGALSGLDEAQKQAILAGAVDSLTPLQKQEILAGAAATLTDEEKSQIRNGYIEQVMASDEVARQIADAVAEANEAKTQINELKSQLDDFGTLYDGIVEYTDGVSQAYEGAQELTDGISDYTDGVSDAESGAIELNDGLQELYEQVRDMDSEISDKINELLDEMTGAGYELESFVSDKNTEVNSVQFIIQTDAIEMPKTSSTEKAEVKNLTFWDKFLKLFGVN